MRYARLTTYDIVKGTFAELTALTEKGILPLFVKEPGFVDHGLLDIGNNKVVAISIWEPATRLRPRPPWPPPGSRKTSPTEFAWSPIQLVAWPSSTALLSPRNQRAD